MGEYLLLAILDEAFQATTTIRGCSFSTQADCDCSEDGAFTATIVTDDEIDKWAKSNCEKIMAHEIGHGHGLDYPVIGWCIYHSRSVLLLANELCSLLHEILVIGSLLRGIASPLLVLKRDPLPLSLQAYQMVIVCLANGNLLKPVADLTRRYRPLQSECLHRGLQFAAASWVPCRMRSA